MRTLYRWTREGLILISLLLLLTVSVFAAEPPAGKTVEGSLVCIGDDMTDAVWETGKALPGYPYIVKPEEHWTSLLAKDLSVPLLNVGIAGQRTDEMLARFQKDVIDCHPDTCIILAGQNDILQGRQIQDVIRNIRTMVTLCRKNDIWPVLVYLPITAPADAVNKQAVHRAAQMLYDAHKEIAEQEHITFVDVHKTKLQGNNGVPSLYTIRDRVHLNAMGQAILAREILAAINDIPDQMPVLPTSVSEWQDTIRHYREKGNTKGALRAAEDALAAYPKAAVLFAARANVYLDQSDADKAEADLQQALQLQPDCIDAWLATGAKRMGEGNVKKGREAFERAAAIEPGNPEVFRSKAYYYDLGIADYPEALSDINHAIQLAAEEDKEEMEFTRIDIELSMYLYTKEIGGQILQDTTELLEAKDLEIDKRTFLLGLRSLIYEKQGAYAKALADNAEIISLRQGNNKKLSVAYSSKASILNEMKEEALAEEAYARAAELDAEVYIPYHYRKLIGGALK